MISFVAAIFVCCVTLASSVPIKMADNILDLSYPYVNHKMPYFPGNKKFFLELTFRGIVARRFFTMRFKFATEEHGGTHYDAPVHFCDKPNCWKPEQIPIDRFVGEACVVDVRENAAKIPNYGLSVSDLIKHEKQHGKIPNGAYVIMYSGWGKYFGNVTAYLGHNGTDRAKMSWPSFHEGATKWLLDNRNIKGIGVDSLSIDNANTFTAMTHRLALHSNKIGLENIANVDKLPARGATIFAFPMNIKGGTGGPARIVAMWNNSAGTMVANYIVLFLAVLLALLTWH